MIEEKSVWDALREVMDPELNRNLVELNMVRKVEIYGSAVRVTVALTAPGCPRQGAIREAVIERLKRVPGVEEVGVELTAMTEEERQKVFGPGPSSCPALPPAAKVIAVASGKGGVGKSTVAVNLALALAEQGVRVGLLDADIYGFSVPRLLGFAGPPRLDEQERLLPFEVRGVKAVSIGIFVGEEVPVIWRGPLLRQALQQFLTEVNWGPLDYLLIDMPPGTGDVALDVAQLIPGSLLVLVTTPERLAATVASRAAHLAQQTHQRILGVIENLSYFTCPNCGERHALFGEGGGQRLADALGVPLLGRLPIVPELQEEEETGAPLPAPVPSLRAALAELAREVRRLAEEKA